LEETVIFHPKAFEGKVILVTGSSRGIGRSTALEFARHGSNVIINYLCRDDLANDVVGEINRNGARAMAVRADVSQAKEVKCLFDKVIDEFGRLDILVNNAGITGDKTLLKKGWEVWDRVIRVNLGGVFNCCQHALPIMAKQLTGRIINVSSVIAQAGNFGQVNYSASKAGIIGLTKSLALEAVRFNVTVNAIAPGFVDTDMVRTIPSDKIDTILNRVPMSRLAEPTEIAWVIMFLASDAASFITGQVINVNGGLYM
jgi:acetoacetyl-CoA reductase